MNDWQLSGIVHNRGCLSPQLRGYTQNALYETQALQLPFLLRIVYGLSYKLKCGATRVKWLGVIIFVSASYFIVPEPARVAPNVELWLPSTYIQPPSAMTKASWDIIKLIETYLTTTLRLFFVVCGHLCMQSQSPRPCVKSLRCHVNLVRISSRLARLRHFVRVVSRTETMTGRKDDLHNPSPTALGSAAGPVACHRHRRLE